MRKFIPGLLASLALVLVAFPSMGDTQRGAPPAAFKKVMIVIFENETYDKVLDHSFFSRFAASGALLTNMHAETHPSQGNYIALVAGDQHGVNNDNNVDLDVRHIGDLLEAKGKSWKVYAEAYPGNCFQGKTSGTYARKHVPFISFKNIQSNPQRCNSHIVEASALETDIQNGTIPDFSLYIPDMNNDGHDTNLDYADKWFEKSFATRMQDQHFMQDMLLIATYDESGFFNFTNHIYTAVVGNSIQPGTQEGTKYSHYSLLRTIEEGLGLDNLGLNDVSATPLVNIWK